MGHTYDDDDDEGEASFSSIPFFLFVGTPLAWWLLTWHGHLYWHSSQPWSPLCNLLLLHPQTDRPLLPVPFTLKLVSLVSLHLEMQLAITSTSGTEKGRHLPTTSYTAMLLPVSFHCLLVHRSSTCCTLYPKFLVPSIQHWLHCHSLLQFCLLLFRMDIGSGYRQSPIVPAVPFIHNSMVTYGISRMWHPPSSRQVNQPRQQPFPWRSSSFITTPVYPSCFLFITNVNLNAFTLEMKLSWYASSASTTILCSKAPISSNTIRVKSSP